MRGNGRNNHAPVCRRRAGMLFIEKATGVMKARPHGGRVDKERRVAVPKRPQKCIIRTRIRSASKGGSRARQYRARAGLLACD